nr:putative uncharacterized protein NEXN-AS1 [Pan paniscus]
MTHLPENLLDQKLLNPQHPTSGRITKKKKKKKKGLETGVGGYAGVCVGGSNRLLNHISPYLPQRPIRKDFLTGTAGRDGDRGWGKWWGTALNFPKDPKGSAEGPAPTPLTEGSLPTVGNAPETQPTRRRGAGQRHCNQKPKAGRHFQTLGQPLVGTPPSPQDAAPRQGSPGPGPARTTAVWRPAPSGAAAEHGQKPQTPSASLQPPLPPPPPPGDPTPPSPLPPAHVPPTLLTLQEPVTGEGPSFRVEGLCASRLAVGRGLGALAANTSAPAAGSPLAAAAAAAAAASSSKFP